MSFFNFSIQSYYSISLWGLESREGKFPGGLGACPASYNHQKEKAPLLRGFEEGTKGFRQALGPAFTMFSGISLYCSKFFWNLEARSRAVAS